MTTPVDPLSLMATTPLSTNTSNNNGSGTSWFAAMSQAWGRTLDAKASQIENTSNQLGSDGNDDPSTIVQLTTEAMEFQFLSQGSNTSVTSAGDALKTMAQKT